MDDECSDISVRSRLRAADPIKKVGYMDGASDGQHATFQSSFNKGYAQGSSFGLSLGFNEAMSSLQERQNEVHLQDVRRINCQICMNSTSIQENVVNLYNMQKEKNDEFVPKLNFNYKNIH